MVDDDNDDFKKCNVKVELFDHSNKTPYHPGIKKLID